MDTLTHALSGALLARAVAPHLPQGSAPALRRAIAAGALAAAFPDSDVVISFFGDQLTYLNLHRGVTHSLLLLPFWALLLAAIFTWLERDRQKRRGYFFLAMAGIAIHIAGDVITTFGTQIFAPFSTWKASLPFTFIIDPWFSGIIIVGLLASWRWRKSTRPALIALALLAGYVGFQGVLSVRAAALGEKYAWQQGYRNAQVAVFPQPLSPFNWKVIVSSEDRYDIAYVNLRRTALPVPPPQEGTLFARLDALYQPVDALTWRHRTQFGDAADEQRLSREVWQAPVMVRVRRFIEYPAVSTINHNATAGTCVWFDDLRFTMADLRSPFRFGACRMDRQGDWHLYRLNGSSLSPL